MPALASTPNASPVPTLNVTADPPTGSFLEGLKPYTALPLVIAYGNHETRGPGRATMSPRSKADVSRLWTAAATRRLGPRRSFRCGTFRVSHRAG